MNDLLSKVSSYNLFNYLFPGTLFAVLAKVFLGVSLILDDLVLALFAYYFVGLVISRIGSIIIEPVLRRTGFLVFADHADFVAASKDDAKIEQLSEANNMYRTLVALFALLGLLNFWQGATKTLPWLEGRGPIIGGILLFVVFLFSYRKQTQYVARRVQAHAIGTAAGSEKDGGRTHG